MDDTIGQRLKRARKRRGLSQQELSHASGVSVSLIRKLEQDDLDDTRMETAHKLARALRVPTTVLLPRGDEQPEGNAVPWLPLQHAVEGPPAQLDEEPSADGISSALDDLRAAFFENRMADVAAMLVPLLRDSDALGMEPEARGLRAHLLNIAGSVLTQARQFQAAERALSRALDESPDRYRSASVIATWTWLLVRQGRVDESRQMAVAWADDLEPRMSRATPDDLAAWGWVLVQASSACLRDNRAGEADDTMRLARSAAVLTGRELSCGSDRLATWGPVTVAYKSAERGIVLERPEQVLTTAARLERTSKQAGTEYHRHRLDVAKAHVMLRQYGDAMHVLSDVHERAPEWLAEQRYARDIMTDVVSRRRTLTPEMRTLADAVRLPL
jgi:transcriptional regulator with XRE-family HTH domain